METINITKSEILHQIKSDKKLNYFWKQVKLNKLFKMRFDMANLDENIFVIYDQVSIDATKKFIGGVSKFNAIWKSLLDEKLEVVNNEENNTEHFQVVPKTTVMQNKYTTSSVSKNQSTNQNVHKKSGSSPFKVIKFWIAGVLLLVAIILMICFFASMSRDHETSTGPNGGVSHITSGGNVSYYQPKTSAWGPESSNFGFAIGAIICGLLGVGAIFLPEPKEAVVFQNVSEQITDSNNKSLKIEGKKWIFVTKSPSKYVCLLETFPEKETLIVVHRYTPLNELNDLIVEYGKYYGLKTTRRKDERFIQDPKTGMKIGFKTFRKRYVCVERYSRKFE